MRRTAVLVLLLLAVVAPARAGFAPEARSPALPAVGLPGSTSTVAVGERSFVLHVPDGLLGPAPLLVVLHGYAKDAASMRRLTGFEALADRDGFVVAFGSAVNGSWNAGTCCGRSRALSVDDVGYLDGVVRESARRVRLDARRLGITGFSNGAMMALRYACDRPLVVSTVAVVAGTVVTPCAPAVPVAALDLHGSGDTTVPLAGGFNRQFGVQLPAVRPAMRAYGPEATVTVTDGAGHGWLPTSSEAVWDWVRDHPRTA